MDWIGFDYINYFYPAILALLAGGSPYINAEIGNPPWTFFILAPLGLLPQTWSLIGINLLTISGLVTFFFVKRKKWLAFPILLSFPFMVLLCNSNLEGLLLWGLAIGGPIGLILLAVKPQAALLIGLVWCVKAWKKGGWKQLAILVSPLILLTIASIILYPVWLDNLLVFTRRTDGGIINGYPWLVPFGIGLGIIAIRKEREDWAAVATLLLMPYVRIQSWTVVLCLLAVTYPLEGSIMALSTWILLLKPTIFK